MAFSKFGSGRLLVEMRRIANSLEFIAVHIARKEGIVYSPRGRSEVSRGEEAELLHTDDAEMLVNELRRQEQFNAQGFSGDSW